MQDDFRLSAAAKSAQLRKAQGKGSGKDPYSTMLAKLGPKLMR